MMLKGILLRIVKFIAIVGFSGIAYYLAEIPLLRVMGSATIPVIGAGIASFIALAVALIFAFILTTALSVRIKIVEKPQGRVADLHEATPQQPAPSKSSPAPPMPQQPPVEEKKIEIVPAAPEAAPAKKQESTAPLPSKSDMIRSVIGAQDIQVETVKKEEAPPQQTSQPPAPPQLPAAAPAIPTERAEIARQVSAAQENAAKPEEPKNETLPPSLPVEIEAMLKPSQEAILAATAAMNEGLEKAGNILLDSVEQAKQNAIEAAKVKEEADKKTAESPAPATGVLKPPPKLEELEEQLEDVVLAARRIKADIDRRKVEDEIEKRRSQAVPTN